MARLITFRRRKAFSRGNSIGGWLSKLETRIRQFNAFHPTRRAKTIEK